jgi:hypothetical protein
MTSSPSESRDDHLLVNVPEGLTPAPFPSEALRQIGWTRYLIPTLKGTQQHTDATLRDITSFVRHILPSLRGDSPPELDTTEETLSWPKASLIEIALRSAENITNNLFGGQHVLDFIPPRPGSIRDRKD